MRFCEESTHAAARGSKLESWTQRLPHDEWDREDFKSCPKSSKEIQLLRQATETSWLFTENATPLLQGLEVDRGCPALLHSTAIIPSNDESNMRASR